MQDSGPVKRTMSVATGIRFSPKTSSGRLSFRFHRAHTRNEENTAYLEGLGAADERGRELTGQNDEL